MVVAGEQGVDPRLLSWGEQVDAGVQGAPRPIQGILGAAPVAVEFLLDAAPALVEGIPGQPNHVEGIMQMTA